jgi:hypothetical protein
MSGHEASVPTRKLLVIALAPVPDDLLERHVPAGERELLEVRMVSPASGISPLQWLTNEEDAARDEARSLAKRGAESVEARASVEADAGDADPVQAAEDALRTFEADEIVVVVPREDEGSWLDRTSVEDGFERFGRPVHYLVGA